MTATSTPKSLQQLFLLYIFMAYFSVVPQIIFYSLDLAGWAGLRDAIIYSSSWLILPALFPRQTRLWLLVCGGIMAVCAMAKIGYFLLFGQELSQSVFMAIFETNPDESSEFLEHYFRWWLPFVLIAFVLPALALLSRLKAVELSKTARVGVVVFALLAAFLPFMKHGYSDKAWSKFGHHFETIEPWGLAQHYTMYRNNHAEAQRLLGKMIEVSSKAPVTLTDNTQKQTYILVLGESTNRNRLSIYGYPRPTSPQLSVYKDSGELLVYQDVISAIPYTIESLSTALSFTPVETVYKAYKNMNIIGEMKRVGFKTFWITNHQALSERNILLTAFAGMADEKVMLNKNRVQNALSADETVLPPLEAALADPADKKLIIVHLMGTHFSYKYRYTEPYKVFDGQQPLTSIPLNDEEFFDYNAYDNSVLYNDFVVSEIIKRYRATDPYGTLLYFSDHGEEVFDIRHFNGRNGADPTTNMYEVPFVLWASPSWAAKRDIKALAATVNRPSMLSDVMHGLCDLYSLQYHECRPERSIFNPAFKPGERMIGERAGRILYEDLRKREQQQKQKQNI